MVYRNGQGAPHRWPVASDSGPRYIDQPRADIGAAFLLLIAGICGVAQWFVAGYPVGQLQPVGGTVSTGAQLLPYLDGSAEVSFTITRIAIVAVTMGGGGLILLALATLLPINHRPLALASLLLAAGAAGAAIWIISKTGQVLGSAAQSMLTEGYFGWYLMVATAVIGAIGALKALVTG